MDIATEQLIHLKVRGEAVEQLKEMADQEDRTVNAQLKRIIREAYVRFQQDEA